MKKVNIKKNQLKFILILNDFYDILCYFRQPFFKLGNKTAQQITNLPIFLSFLIMFLSILQISFDTKNSSILKNYPLLVNLTNKKIPQKFETLYLQLEKIQEKERLFNDKQQLVDLKLKTNQPEFPTIFHHIQNTKQKQNTINLYKTFEQMGPILLSEIQKTTTGADGESSYEPKKYPEAIIHLGVNIPYQSWSSNTKNFNITEDKLLTNWRFNDSDLIIQDFKKDGLANNTHNIIQEFIVQYKNYVKEIEDTKYISFKNLPFQKVQMTQNSDTIFIKGLLGKSVLQPTGFLYKNFGSFLNNPKFKKEKYPPSKCLKNNCFSKNNNPNKGPDWPQKQLKKKKIVQFSKNLLSGKELNPINSRKSQKEILYLTNIQSPLSQILQEAMFVRWPQNSPFKDALESGQAPEKLP